jgi:hypothetical protein
MSYTIILMQEIAAIASVIFCEMVVEMPLNPVYVGKSIGPTVQRRSLLVCSKHLEPP